MTIQVVDFFSGCGGTSAGLRAAGLEVVLGLDNDPDAAGTFRANLNGVAFLERDIRTVTPEDIHEHISVHRRRCPLLFSACAPCQPFSRQRRGRETRDERYPLLLEFVRFIWAFRPDLIFLENVPGVNVATGAMRPFRTLLDSLSSLQYHTEYRIVECCNYGVPQRRRRLILIASRLGPISFPMATHGPGTDHVAYSTVRDWIGHLPPIAAGEEHSEIPNHRAAILSPLNLQRIQNTPPEATRSEWPMELRLKCHQNEYKGHTDVYGRLRWDEVSSGITTRCISLSNGRFGHPEQHRAISVREAACLQTLPMDFVLSGSLTSMARQVGNAVPVLLAQRFGDRFIEHVAEYNGGGR